MQSVDVRVESDRGWFGPFHRGAIEAADLRLDALHEVRLLADGSSVMLYAFTGGRDTAERLAADRIGDDGEWQVATVDGRKLMFARTRPSAMSQGLLSVLDRRPLVVDWPVLFPTDDTLLLTLIGDRGEIRETLEAVPDGVTVSVERTGDYQPEPDRVLATLTPRERETVLTAVELGYYRNPRGTCYATIADAVGCTPSTVGHHIRNAESKLLGRLLEPRTGHVGPADQG